MGYGQCGQPKNVPAHTAHNPDDEVVLFSVIKWTCFRLSRCKRNGQSGPLFGDQMDLFSIDKNSDGSSQRRASEMTSFQKQVLETLDWPAPQAYAGLTPLVH